MKKIILVLAIVLVGCARPDRSNEEKVVRKWERIRTVTVVDINGDTIMITGGATCHVNRKIK